ncbi:MAG: family 16 glycosylhydrolase [Sedimentisphaerales bacterium]|nr:family 16 glycosylhydrolase [Sedimentisphaerales bacterium]
MIGVSFFRLFGWVAGILVAFAVAAGAQQKPGNVNGVQGAGDDWGNPKIAVEQKEGEWVIAGKIRRVVFNKGDFSIVVQAGGVKWKMNGCAGDDITVESGGQRRNFKLCDAKKVEISSYENGFAKGVKVRLEGFKSQEEKIDLALSLFICLEGADEELVFLVVPEEKEAALKECLWPKGFAAESFDFTVVPFMQGMLLGKNHPDKVWLYDTVSYGRGLYMPWWGHQQGKAAAAVILESPDDAGCRFAHPAGGPTQMQPRWMHSLGKMRYKRQLRICFFEQGNYVDLAKRYRKYVIETGHFVSLAEKIARNPIVGRLIGSPVIHTNILYHIQPDSSYYDKDNPQKNHQLTTFAERAEHLRKLSEKGIKQAYVHLDGWGFRGYDNLHPDILPPCPEAGGWKGMKLFGETCEELGYVFAVHDQYRDYYLDAKSYDDEHCLVQEDGHRPYGSTWFGGKQSILCPSLSPGHVRKNHTSILAHGVKLRGAYLDVFAVVPPEECYHPDHPVTRSECLRYRGDCLDFIRTQVGVVSSEEPADWAIPHLDLVHHGPYALVPNPGKGPAMGIPVPLFSLVYHDALLLPWTLTKGGWGIPDNDWGLLHGLANAGLPYLSLNPGEEELKRVRTMCDLHRRVGMLEMTGHEFLDGGWRRQRTTFADGTTVTVDFDADTYEITPALGEADKQSSDSNGRKLLWHDEFDYEGLPDNTKWNYEEGFVRNGESQYYTRARKENARVENGMLVIEGRNEKFKNPQYKTGATYWSDQPEYASYTAASLITQGKSSWKYGRIEVRAQLPQGKGVWPAIWMLGVNFPEIGWLRCGEIDIMEFVGKEPDRIYATMHFAEEGKHRSNGWSIGADQPYADFHVYAIEWQPDRIDFFYDETKYFTFMIDKAGEGKDNPFRKPHYLLINLALGGSWGGPIDDAMLPQKYLIDYVRVYEPQRSPDLDSGSKK